MDATGLWQRHGAHLTRRAATPEPHDSLPGYLRLAERAYEHEQRSADRQRTASTLALFLLGALLLTIVPLFVPATRSFWGWVVMVLAVVALVVLVARPVSIWMRYVPWIRPRFR